MRHTDSYSIEELSIQRDSVIKQWNTLLQGEDLQMHISLEYYHTRISSFHSRIVKVKMSSMTLDMKEEICTRLIKKVILMEQSIALRKNQYRDIQTKALESYKNVVEFYNMAIAKKEKEIAELGG